MSNTRRTSIIAHKGGQSSPYGVHMPTERGLAFATLIATAREKKKWRQEDLADHTGVSRRTITRWESGYADRPDLKQVRVVCLALGILPIRAAVALGLVTEEEAGLPPEPPRQLDPVAEEILAMWEDPAVSDEDKYAGLQYLRYLSRQKPPNGGQRPAADAG